MVGGNNVRRAQDRNGLVASRLEAQLVQPTVRGRRKRFFAGPLPLPAHNVGSSTAIASTRLFLQAATVAKELSLANVIAGPGPIQ